MKPLNAMRSSGERSVMMVLPPQWWHSLNGGAMSSRAEDHFQEESCNGADAVHRQQELLVLVDAPVDRDESRRHRFSGGGHLARRQGFQGAADKDLRYRQGPGAGGRRPPCLG